MSEGPMQRHPIFESQIESAPVDYPEPKPGKVTRWRLTTPDGTKVGTLLFNDDGVQWTPADTEDTSAQEHAAELLQYLRGHRDEDIDLADALAGIADAYTGDYTEDQVRYVSHG